MAFQMGKWGYNLYEWSYFNLLITGFWAHRVDIPPFVFLGGVEKANPSYIGKKNKKKSLKITSNICCSHLRPTPSNIGKKQQKIGG